jgi:hypothetical protein
MARILKLGERALIAHLEAGTHKLEGSLARLHDHGAVRKGATRRLSADAALPISERMLKQLHLTQRSRGYSK